MPDEETPNEPQNLRQVREALERETQRRKEAETARDEAAGARRELALLRAGVDTETPVGKLFAKAYDGELDVDAIKSQWEALAPQATEPPAETEPPAPQPDPTPETGMPADRAAALAQARSGLQSGATPPGSEPTSPLGQAMMDAAFNAQQGQRARPSGGFGPKPRDAALDVLFERAKGGDPQAVFKRPDETWADATERWREGQ